MIQKWCWERSFGHKSYVVIYEALGWLPEEMPSRTIQQHDISYDGRQRLAAKLDLSASNFDHWAKLDRVENNAEGIWVYIVVNSTWLNRSVWQWKAKTLSADLRRKWFWSYFGDNPGPDIIQRLQDRTFQKSDLSHEARNALAREIQLDANDFDLWADAVEVAPNKDGVEISIGVLYCWLVRYSWHWSRSSWFGSGQSEIEYETFYGEKMTASAFLHLREQHEPKKLISSAGRQELSREVELNPDEFNE